MTSDRVWEPAASFLRLGPVDQERMQQELWQLWERLGAEVHTTFHERGYTTERELLNSLTAAIHQAHNLSQVLCRLRLEDQDRGPGAL